MGFAEDPSAVICPSIEVRASLFMPPNLHGQDFPATIRISEPDLHRVLDGALITKVIYLENPDLAAPGPTTPDQPLEREVLRGDDPVEIARRRGRVLAIVCIGGRPLSQEELAQVAVPGVVQVAGEPLGPPACPPMIPARTFQLFDPASGPRVPTEELVTNGGDVGPRIGVGPYGQIGNLNSTDAAAIYNFADQSRRTTTSNRICLFAPRFGVIQEVTAIAGFHGALPPLGTISVMGVIENRTRQPSLNFEEILSPAAVVARKSLHGARSNEGVHELDQVAALAMTAMIEGVALKATVVELAGFTQYRDYCKPNEPLVLAKSAEPREALPGDIVTITLRFSNYGSRPARNLEISDNLGPRLEYIPGTSAGDRPTVFTFQANEVGSATLRWTIPGELPAGQSGMIQFQVRVR
jgi:uncharacterized repeat protein (TIGR01451 family)